MEIIMEVKWAQFSKVVLEIIVSLSRFFSCIERDRSLRGLYSHLIISCLACYELAAKLANTEPGSVGDISGSCTSEYGKHQVPFFTSELYLDQ